MGAAERRQMETDVDHIPKPTWQRDEHLSTLPEVWQEDLYHEKMNKLKRKEEAMVTERAVLMPECTALGIVECFQRLGWEAALTFRDEEGQDKIPMKAVIGWMATLMQFDSLPAGMYVYPPDKPMFDKGPSGKEGIAILQKLFRHGSTGALHDETPYVRKMHKTFTLSKLDKNDWEYTTTDRYYIFEGQIHETNIERVENRSNGASEEKHRERQELIARSNAYFAQQEINARFEDNEQIRHYEDYYAGRPYREHPRPVDWSTTQQGNLVCF
ncbi:hypothetical protein E3N88_33222 [Mikania micrantha]|uniref:Uncharacterized protein n=1 Tax=Mikania micrantha TaxID=192012 RepID=A0A5N6MB76_9ASTR|nr:hypothetical protein E3N88_33222 [Mikania micrantha]